MATANQTTINPTIDLAEAVRRLGGKPVAAAFKQTVIQASNLSSTQTKIWLDPKIKNKLALAISSGKHVYLYGPPGVGKSTVCRAVLEKSFGKDFLRFQFHSSTTADDLIGTLAPSASGGFQYQWSPILEACDNGTPCIMEEVNSLRAEHSFPLFSLLDHTPWYDVVLAGKERRITKKDGWQAFVTGNDNGSGDKAHLFGGSEIMNRALLERFAYFIKMEYLPKPMEQEMIIEKTGLKDAKLLDALLNVATETRKLAADDPSRAELAISPRTVLEWATAYVITKQGNIKLDHRQIAEMAVVDRLPDSCRDTVLTAVDNKFAGIDISKIQTT